MSLNVALGDIDRLLQQMERTQQRQTAKTARPPAATDVGESPELRSFLSRLDRGRVSEASLVNVGRHLLDGAVRIRGGGGGLYGRSSEKVVSKPIEAIGEWLGCIEEASTGGVPRVQEAREAVAAAAEELEHSAQSDSARKLRSALYSDAAIALGGDRPATSAPESPSPWPWIAGGLGGILLGILLGRFLR